MMSNNVRNLAAAIMLQAAKEYCGLDPNPASKKSILNNLRSPWMSGLTEGVSIVVAEQLKNHEDEIRQRLKRGLCNEE